MATFNELVYALVRRIPRGHVMTYGSVARALGDPRKAREVGWAMHGCPDDVPAHRVVNRQGAISGAENHIGLSRRQVLLQAEGITFDAAGRCALAVVEWTPSVALCERIRTDLLEADRRA